MTQFAALSKPGSLGATVSDLRAAGSEVLFDANDGTHGTQDWMFPPEMAQGAERALQQAGADVSYREIADLSHTYPRDENAGLLDWFMS